MIRRFTLLCLIFAAISGLRLYSVKRDAQMQDREIARITHDTKDVRTHAALLHAEYDLLSDPDRLKDLASQVLKLQSTDPKQYVSLNDLEKRLPPVGKLPTLPTPPEPADVEPAPPPAQAVAPTAAEPAKPDLVARTEKPAEPASDKAAQLARMMAALTSASGASASASPIASACVRQSCSALTRGTACCSLGSSSWNSFHSTRVRTVGTATIVG